MPEKQSQGFGQAEKGQTFVIGGQNGNGQAESAQGQPQQEGKQIVLNIAQTSASTTGKVMLRQRETYVKYTGNFFIDTFRRLNDFVIDHSGVKIRDKATFFRLLAVMINSGLPLIKSLRTLAVQQEKSPKLARSLFEMAIAIEGGKSFSQAMADYDDIFSEAQVGMIHAGEASGQLNKTLRDLADDVEKTAGLTGKIRGALIYPAAILTLLVIVIFVMMIAVIPQMTQLFAQSGHDLPLPTQILIGLSAFCTNYWPVILIGGVGLVVGIMAWKQTRTGKYLWDYMMIKLPIFGPLMQKAALSKFSRSLSSLMSSGVPIIKAIEITAAAVGNEVYKRRLILTAEDMRRGIPMAENMAESKLFPTLLVNMIEVGEQTAQLESVTLKVAEFYDEEVDTVVSALTKIMEPMIIVVIGVAVGGMVAAIMLPIIQLTNITGGMS
jgi:type IV pilus assembly protein PilC